MARKFIRLIDLYVIISEVDRDTVQFLGDCVNIACNFQPYVFGILIPQLHNNYNYS